MKTIITFIMLDCSISIYSLQSSVDTIFTNDKKNGVLANGSAELLLSQLAEIEISVLEEMINTDLFVKELPFDVPQLIQ